jgi:hypothetical protein
MGDSKKIESLVEHAVGEVLNRLLPGLRQQIATEVLQALRSELDMPVGQDDGPALSEALAAIQSGTTQVQILDAMVDGVSKFVTRTALFVVRGSDAVGWRARGFADDDGVRTSPLLLSSGLAAKAIHARGPITGPASDFLQGFAERFGDPIQEPLVSPLMVRDKVVALVYADGGTETHHFDRAALETLIRNTGLWLEVFATRKMSGPAHVVEHSVDVPTPMASAASASVSPVAVASSSAVAVETAPVAPVQAPAKHEDEVHKKARRFAKLLVDEIKLYNQAKVAEGRQHRDLYDRLKEDIEKSRASYEKRYGNTPARDTDYFNQELVRILADNDPAILGDNFPR